MIILYQDGSYISVSDSSTHEYQNDPDFLSLLPEWGVTSTKIADRIHSLVGSIKELEAELDAERKRRGSLQFQLDYLQRGCADDALTIHTCEEIIDRTKKELGTYRELHFDNTKRISELEAALKEAVRLLREGKRLFAPNTTNSDVDYFLGKHGEK